MSLKAKEALQIFTTAPWTSTEQVTQFAADASPMVPGDVQKLLQVVLDRTTHVDAPKHQGRCIAFGHIVAQNPSPELFSPLARALRLADLKLRGILVQLLPRVNNVSKHVDLCQVIGAPEPEVRQAAVEALKPIIGPSGFEVLRGLVGEQGFAGRMEAMEVVASKAVQHAIPLFEVVLEAGKTTERSQALKYLSDPRLLGKDLTTARNAILKAFDDPEPALAQQATEALAAVCTDEEFFVTLGDRAERANIHQTKAIIAAISRYSSPLVIDFLGKKFAAGPNAIRLVVLDSLLAINGDEVLPLLLEALASPKIAIRMRAAEVLTKLGEGGRVDIARVIIWLLRSRDADIRRLAVDIVKRVGDTTGELTPKLLRFLRDEDWWVRERVMDTLVELAGATLARHLAAMLQDPSDVVRRFAIGGLARVKDPRALGALVRSALDDEDWWVREQAILAMGTLGDPKAVPYLLEVMKRHPYERLVCVESLAKLQATDVADQLVPLLEEDDASVRLAVVKFLGKANARTHAAALKKLENDPDFDTRAAVHELLARWQILAAAVEAAGEEGLGVLDKLLVQISKMGADDLILIPGKPPYAKKHGRVSPLDEKDIPAAQMKAILFAHLTPHQVATLAKAADVDFSHEVKTHHLRFRGHVFSERRGFAGVFRIVKNEIPDIDKLGLPPVIRSFAHYKNGLVLVGGPTGAGKSTTLAAIIDFINRTYDKHIITVEDPIEVMHNHKKSLINQREVGSHTGSFTDAMRSTLRQDPDVILVGEMRDLATIQFAVSAAETGHLVFGTVHTVSAETTVDRLVNTFPAGQQPQVRAMLAESLRAVVCQYLLKRSDTEGRALAVEVMLNNDAISMMLRKGKTFQIGSVIQTSRDIGMQSMDQELVRLVKAAQVTKEEAYAKANDKKMFEAAFAPPPSTAAGQPGQPSSGNPAQNSANPAFVPPNMPPGTGPHPPHSNVPQSDRKIPVAPPSSQQGIAGLVETAKRKVFGG